MEQYYITRLTKVEVEKNFESARKFWKGLVKYIGSTKKVLRKFLEITRRALEKLKESTVKILWDIVLLGPYTNTFIFVILLYM